MHRNGPFDQGFLRFLVSSSQLPSVHPVRIGQCALQIVVIINLHADPAADPSPGTDDYRGEQTWPHLEPIEAPAVELRLDAEHLADIETAKAIDSLRF